MCDGDVCLCLALAPPVASCLMMRWHVAILRKTLFHEREREREQVKYACASVFLHCVCIYVWVHTHLRASGGRTAGGLPGWCQHCTEGMKRATWVQRRVYCLCVCCVKDRLQHASVTRMHDANTELYARVACLCMCVCVVSFDVCTCVLCMHVVTYQSAKRCRHWQKQHARSCKYDGDVCLCVALASAAAPCMKMRWHVAILPKTLSHERERERERKREAEGQQDKTSTRKDVGTSGFLSLLISLSRSLQPQTPSITIKQMQRQRVTTHHLYPACVVYYTPIYTELHSAHTSNERDAS